MTDVLERPSEAHHAAPTLRVRGPAYGVITECLRIQASARTQSRVARLFGASPLQPDARSWYRAARAEIALVKDLKNLPPTFTLLHADIDSAIDHVIVGPTGVFTIGTKNHTGHKVTVAGDRLLVNGHRTDHIRDARYEAHQAARLISSGVGDAVDVTPIIAVVDPGSLSGRVPGVLVLSSRRVPRAILGGRARLSDATITLILGAAELGGTWHTDSRVHDDTLRHEARFARLRSEVEGAASRRWIWVATAIVVTLAALAVVPLVL